MIQRIILTITNTQLHQIQIIKQEFNDLDDSKNTINYH